MYSSTILAEVAASHEEQTANGFSAFVSLGDIRIEVHKKLLKISNYEGLFCQFSQSPEYLILTFALNSFQGIWSVSNCSGSGLDSCKLDGGQHSLLYSPSLWVLILTKVWEAFHDQFVLPR